MKRKKIFCVFGTRPEAVKMAPVVKQLRLFKGALDVKVCVTAQHRTMLDDVLNVFGIRPEYDLNIMAEGQSLEHITEQVIRKLSPILTKEKPDLVLIHGDTSTTLLAAITSFYKKIPVGHVEAGLRSYDYQNPFPEEANRRLADALCTLHFPPTVAGKRNLLKENLPSGTIFVTGNTVIDALRWAARQNHKFTNKTLSRFLASLPTKAPAQLILVTAHRRENFGEPLHNICRALRRVVNKNPGAHIIYPVHPNPNVLKVAGKVLANHPRILLLPPLNYLDFLHLLKICTLVVTDSGGLQEEAPSLGKPVLVLRKVTERPEAVRCGTARVIGTQESKIFKEVSRLLRDPALYRKMSAAVNPYGDGKASERIAQAILYFFNFRKTKPKGFSR